MPFFAKIPYLHEETNFLLRKELVSLVSKFYPQVKLNIIFENKFSIASFFRDKDKIPKALLSNIVYKYTCPHCSGSYVGSTSRHLTTRIAEHRGVSARTGRPLCNVQSNIYQHRVDTGQCVTGCIYQHRVGTGYGAVLLIRNRVL